MLDRLLRRYSTWLADRDELWLTSLDIDGSPAAAWLGFAWRDTVYFYQGGRDPRWDAEGAGQVLTGAMVRRAIERGFRRYDFLRGRDDYKLSWTSKQRSIHELIVFRPGVRGMWFRALDAAGRARARLRSRAEFAAGDS
jgi:CelD/BcsL family acetyltransferase involved in cellulose biosynthesis